MSRLWFPTHHHNIESAIEDADDFGITNDGSVLLGQIVNEVTEMQMSGLFLSNLSSIPLCIAMLGTFGNLVSLHDEFGLWCFWYRAKLW
jgi:hypothetical protein